MRRGVHRSRRVASRRVARRRVARRRAVALLLLGAIGAGLWFAVSEWTSPSNGTALATTTTSDPPAPSTTTLPPTTTTTTTQPPGGFSHIGEFGVGTASLPLVEPGVGTQPQRTLPTAVWYPLTSGERPVVVFSQGFLTPVDKYGLLLHDWASAGFVVVAPTYPTTTPTPAKTATLEEDDIIHHPDDLRFVVQTVLADGHRAGTVLSGRVDPAEVGLAGQSDGGDVSLAVAANSQWYTSEIKAVAVLSGAEFAGFGGTYFAPGLPSVPLLVVQSDADTVNAPSCGSQIYNAAPSPKYYLGLHGVTHLGPYTTPGAYLTVVAHVTTRFFDAELARQAPALSGIGAIADKPGISGITAAASIPPGSGTCVDAPT